MIKRKKWQTGESAFNEVSGAVHARANNTLFNIRFSISTRISLRYATILVASLFLMALALGAMYVYALGPRMSDAREYVNARLLSMAEEYARTHRATSATPTYSPTIEAAANRVPGLPTVPAADAIDSGIGVRGQGAAADLAAQIATITDPLAQDAEQSPPDSATSITPPLSPTIYALLYAPDGSVVFDNVPRQLTGAGAAFQFYEMRMFYREFFTLEVNGAGYTACFCRDVQFEFDVLLYLLAAIAAFDILRGAYFVIRRRSINADVLQPIVEISETARHLSGSNMSERINVEGTKSELRELAETINEMLDRLENAYNAQKQFVSDASHELRTPIAVIQGYANLLARWGKDSEDVRDESIAAIIKESANMKELVEKLLFLARHDKKTLKLNIAPFGARDMLEDLIKETEMIDRDHAIKRGRLDPVTVTGDEMSIKQCVRIFIDNACKYTPAGGTVTISCERGGLGCKISVADTGRGIPKEQLSKVFERFYRVDDVRASVTGHGLGLAIARIIAVSHNGKIHVTSRVGEGSVFTLEIPGEIAPALPGDAVSDAAGNVAGGAV